MPESRSKKRNNHNSVRKAIVTEIMSRNKHLMLLDELRWFTLIEENNRKGVSFSEMQRKHQVSVARTIRDHMPDLQLIHKPRPDKIFAGIVVRAAIFRLERRTDVERFLANPDAEIECRFDTLDGNRKCICDLYCPNYVARKFFPVTSPITLVCRETPTTEQLAEIAAIPWALYRTTSNHRTTLACDEPILRRRLNDIKRELRDLEDFDEL